MKMRSLLAATALASSAGLAMAADLPRRTAPMMNYAAPPPLFSWTGFYAGVNAGANFGTGSSTATPAFFTGSNGFLQSASPGAGFGPFRSKGGGIGFVGGGQIGYNIQNGMFVYGIEADIDYFGTGGHGSRSYADGNVFTNGTFRLQGRSSDGYLGTVRGRVGLAAFDRTLLYATGGLAYGNYGTSPNLARFANSTNTQILDFTGSPNDDTRVGYALGAGVEYAITPHISGKAEYLYTDLGSRRYQLTNASTAAVINVRSPGDAQMARLGLNYKF